MVFRSREAIFVWCRPSHCQPGTEHVAQAMPGDPRNSGRFDCNLEPRTVVKAFLFPVLQDLCPIPGKDAIRALLLGMNY